MAFFYKVNMDISGGDEAEYQQGVGYSIGGKTPTASSTNVFTAIDYATETTYTPALFLTNLRRGMCGLSSSSVGLICGGIATDVGAYVNDIDGINFTSETSISISNVLGSAIWKAAALNGPSSGFLWSGGYGTNGSTTVSVVNFASSVSFSTYTSTAHSSKAATARINAAGVASSTNGYGLGGDLTTEIDGIIFSSVTSTNPSAVLGGVRNGAVGLDNGNISFCASGSNTTGATTAAPGGQTSVFGFNLATAATFSVSSVFTTATTYAQAVNSTQAGYLLGGENTSSSILTSIKKIGFLSQATSNVSSTLSIGQSGGSGVWTRVFHNMTGRAYTAGGYNGSSNHGDVNALDFSNNSTKVVNGSISAKRHHGNLSSTNKGYFVCGYTSAYINTINKIIYSTETISIPSVVMSYGNANAGSLSSYARGYYIGGDTTTAIGGFIFDTETAFATGTYIPTANNYVGSYSNQKTTYGWIFGGNADTSRIQAMNLSTEVTFSCTNTLLVGGYGSQCVGHDTKASAYVCGGYNGAMGGVIATILSYSPTSTPTTITTSMSANSLANVRHIGSAASSSSTGYCIGGHTTTWSNTTDKVDLSTASSVPLGASNTLAQLSGYCATVYTDVMFKNFNLAGFVFGGWLDASNVTTNIVECYDFASEALYSVLNTATNNATQAAVSSITSGYLGGGDVSTSTVYGLVDKFIYSTKTYTFALGALQDGARANADGVNSSTIGYFGGGRNRADTVSAVYTRIDGVIFATDTMYNPATAALSNSRCAATGVNSATVGYWTGGMVDTAGTRTRSCETITFSTEAMANTANVLPSSRGNLAGTNSSSTAYFMGGDSAPSTAYTTCYKMTFPTLSTVTLAATLSRAKRALKGMGNEVAGYAVGGGNSTLSVSYNEIEKLTYSSETISLRDAVLTVARSRAASLSAI